MSELTGRKAVVVGASRGFGRGIAEALAAAGADVHALARSDSTYSGQIYAITADATDPEVPSRVLREIRPNIVVLNAGANPELAPIHEQTWDTFSVNWNTDVKIAFQWTKAILNEPLTRGSSVIAFSSGAALRGSPLSGGYAGAKATVRFVAQYAADEVSRAKLDIRFAAILPVLTYTTDLGRAAVEAYAHRAGRSVEQARAQFGDALTSVAVGASVVRLVLDRSLDEHRAFRLDAGGLTPLT